MKKLDTRYVDMCIYIDTHIHEKNHDANKICEYLIALSTMLAKKRRFFNSKELYDKFAVYYAWLMYERLSTERQYLPKDDPLYLEPIKSCLNYMKQTIYAKKCAFANSEFRKTLPEDDRESMLKADALQDYLDTTVFTTNTDLLVCDINFYLKTIDKIVKRYVYEGAYGKDEVLAWKLYTSCLLSLLRNFTLSRKNKLRLIDIPKSREEYKNTGKKVIYYKANYAELMPMCVAEETETAPIVYDLSDEYLDYVAVILQKVKVAMVRDITELGAEYSIPDTMVEDLLLSEVVDNEED